MESKEAFDYTIPSFSVIIYRGRSESLLAGSSRRWIQNIQYNNLGGTSNLELSITANAAIRYLVDVLQVVVVRVYAGSLTTSLEMAGVSLTLLKLSPDWLPYLEMAL